VSFTQYVCCSPQQWEGDIAGFNLVQNESFFEYFYYDFANRRVRADLYERQGSTRTRKIIIEKEIKGATFIYEIYPNGTCQYHQNDRSVRQMCVRGDFSHRLDYTLGAELAVSMFIYQHDVFQEDLVFTKNDCIPVSGFFFEHHGREYKFDGDIRFWNIVQGIANPNVFQTPSNCVQDPAYVLA
jgi:hypothetical protein